jgi:hypothetical protein
MIENISVLVVAVPETPVRRLPVVLLKSRIITSGLELW